MLATAAPAFVCLQRSHCTALSKLTFYCLLLTFLSVWAGSELNSDGVRCVFPLNDAVSAVSYGMPIEAGESFWDQRMPLVDTRLQPWNPGLWLDDFVSFYFKSVNAKMQKKQQLEFDNNNNSEV